MKSREQMLVFLQSLYRAEKLKFVDCGYIPYHYSIYIRSNNQGVFGAWKLFGLADALDNLMTIASMGSFEISIHEVTNISTLNNKLEA